MTISCNSLTGTCGTGGWTGPKPGDPDNNSALSATPAFGGIEVAWTYPTINPWAVAYVDVYRAISIAQEGGEEVPPEFENALHIARVTADRFRDQLEIPKTYYYWIRITSTNGTEADPVGPVSAMPRPLIDDLLPALSGNISVGDLAQDLSNEINKIPVTADQVRQEILDRIAGNAVLEKALADMQAGVTEAIGFITEEVNVRTEGQNALAERIDTVGVMTDQAAAAVKSEELARIEWDGVLAGRIDSTQSQFEDQMAAVEVKMQTQIDTVNGEVQDIGALYTAKLSVNGLVGGFGMHNDGTTVEAGFDVDTFWVGRSNTDKVKPFIIIDGETFINEAVINKLTFAKLADQTGQFVVEDGKLLAKYISAETLSALTANLGDVTAGTIKGKDNKVVIDLNTGKAEFGDVKVRGDVEATTIKADSIDIINSLHIQGDAVILPLFAEGASRGLSTAWETLFTIVAPVDARTAMVDAWLAYLYAEHTYGDVDTGYRTQYTSYAARILKNGTQVHHVPNIHSGIAPGDSETSFSPTGLKAVFSDVKAGDTFVFQVAPANASSGFYKGVGAHNMTFTLVRKG